ncbi:MAG: hypothetical protein AAF656_07030, partial [Planctomycetota bacterium]
MSEHITHIALSDDGRRLANITPGLPATLLDTWNAHPRESYAGAITRYTDKISPDVIDHCRRAEAGEIDDETWPKKLAFCLGALTHRAADRIMKPVYQYFKKLPDYGGVNICTIYHDVFTLKNIVAKHGPYTSALLDAEDEGKFAEVMDTLLGRSLVRLHTIKPDVSDTHAWFERLFDAMQEFHIRIDIYRQIMRDWDAAEVKRYVEEPNFYNVADPMIDVIERLRAGTTVAPAELDDAVAATGES